MMVEFNRLIIVAYRIPFRVDVYGEDEKVVQNSGGLVSAILSLSQRMKDQGLLAERKKILWFGYAEPSDEKDHPTLSNETFEVHPVVIGNEMNSAYYGGFCNSTIWPLFHYYPFITKFDNSDYEAYLAANELFFNGLRKVHSTRRPCLGA
jgi:trehalose 6-phosphate synthase/phosphatase